MKKICSGLALLSAFAFTAKAQLSTGGLPLTIQKDAKYDYVPVTNAALPEMNKGLKHWEAVPEPKPALVALMAPASLGFPHSGIMYNAGNNMRVWKAQLKVEDAHALSLYYDRFHLPEGVKLFLTNANNRQVLGGYTSSNNNASGKFATEAVAGDLINIELDIEPQVHTETIQFHVDRAAVYLTGIDHLKAYQDVHTIDAYDSIYTGASSVCMIDAICPLGVNYAAQRDAAFQALIPVTFNGTEGLGSCSATMINTAANTPGNCKQYFLLATHCEFTNAIADSGFSQLILRFNYQRNTCNPTNNPGMNTQQTMTGATFVSRAVLPLDSMGFPIAGQIKGDFLLLELNNALPESWGMNLAGWNNSPDIPTSNVAPKKFIGFHHPAGDVKKVSSAHTIQSFGLNDPTSHWLIQQLDSGLISSGTSGSALFDGDGHAIGIASLEATGQGLNASCKQNALGQDVSQITSKTIFYSKLSYDWDYSVDGNASNRKLKPWLDPANSGAITVNTVKSNCTALENSTGITNNHSLFGQAIAVFPNPSKDGKVTVQFNLSESSDLQLSLYDISGKKLNTYSLKNVRTGAFNIDLSQYSNGMYLLQLSDGFNTSNKKIMLSK